MEGKTCLVTGATGALGAATATGLVRQGATVVLTTRSRERGEGTLAEVSNAGRGGAAELVIADLATMESVRRLAAEITESHHELDVLVNTAAVYTRRRAITTDGFELMFATNHLGPFLLTNLLLGPLRAAAPARVITVSAPSTTTLDFDDLQGQRKFSSLHAFGASKMANLLFAFELARRLEGTGVTSNVLHPGLMKSRLMREAPAFARFITRLAGKPPERAAEAAAHLASAQELRQVTGRFFKGTTPANPPRDALDRAAQARLWNVSSELTGLSVGGGRP